MVAATGILGFVPIMINQMNKKPPTQGVGVSGFRADVYASDEQKINYRWGDLIHLPPFQMFAAEISHRNSCDSLEWIKGFVRDRVSAVGEKNLFDDFSKWHRNKGYWKGEDVYGNLINED